MSFRTTLTFAFFLTASATFLGAAGTSAAAQTTRVSSADRAACMPDAVRLCRDQLPNIRRVVMCFLDKRAKLSRGCNAVLANYGL